MKTWRSAASCAALAVTMAVSGCASGTGGAAEAGAPGGATDATIVVMNETGSSPVNIYIEPVNGVRVNLGQVQPNATGTFRHPVAGGQHVLVAQGATTGGTRTSSQFTLRAGRTITWDLLSGRVTFRDR